MASGDSLVAFVATDNHPPGSNIATPDVRNTHPVLDFDASSQEGAIFSSVLPRHYGGGGVTARLFWMASSATSGNVRWRVRLERHQANTDDLDADSFAGTGVLATAAAPGTSGQVQQTDLAISGSDLDAIAAGESFRLEVVRVAADAADTMAGDAELLAVELRET
jgi:hypothetical protein